MSAFMIELIIVVVILVVLFACMGAGLNLIIAGLALLIALMVTAMLVLFFYSLLRIAASEKSEAVFIRIEKSDKGAFSSAYYLVDGAEYPCVFPAETLLRDSVYKCDVPCRVMLDRKKQRVYDRNALITTVIGFVFSLIISAWGIALIVINFF